MAKYIFGIDLGTTYSCIAYVDETGRATVVNNHEGSNTTPSVVNFANPQKVVVGQIAKETSVLDPNNTVSLVKTLMGKSSFAINYNGKDITPEEVSSYILRKVAEDASKILDTEVKDVVITCPAYFGSAEVEATKAAGEMAGLNVIEIIREPTAAAIYYGVAREQDEKTILVYDLGGGTFDVTIMKVGNGNTEVICSDGSSELGGKDWDESIMHYLADEFVSETGSDGDFDEYTQQDLRLKAEANKKYLDQRDEVPVMVDSAGLRARITISKDTFEQITESLLNETLEKTDAAIATAKEKGYEIDEILLVGGSTRMPKVKKALMDRYNIEPKILEPDEAVAKGAAIYALGAYTEKHELVNDKKTTGESTNDDDKAYAEEPAVPVDLIPNWHKGNKMSESIIVATTKSYALKVLVNKTEEKCCNMIIKNEPMPDGLVSVTKQFGTAEDNMETAELVVYESDFDSEYYDVDEDFMLGTCSLSLPGNLPEGAPIQVTFTLNKEGILEVTGLDVTTGGEIHATMQAKSGTTLTNEEIQEVKEKSKNIVVE